MLSWFEWQVFWIRWTHKSKVVRSNVSAKNLANVIKFTAFIDQIYFFFFVKWQSKRLCIFRLPNTGHHPPTYLLNLNKHLTNVLLNSFSHIFSVYSRKSLDVMEVLGKCLTMGDQNGVLMWSLQITNWMDSCYDFHTNIGLFNACWQWNASLLPYWNLSYQSKTSTSLNSILCALIHSLRTGKGSVLFSFIKNYSCATRLQRPFYIHALLGGFHFSDRINQFPGAHSPMVINRYLILL